MAINSYKFKPNENKLTEYRVKQVMQYMSYCYLQMVRDKKTYDYSKKGKLKQEDFLRNGLVDDYLSKKEYKDYYKNIISDNPNVEIYFQKEENQVYEADGKLADDYIDISVKETKLSELLSSKTSEEIKFAVECKRINTKSDCEEYVGDIQKFADRDYTTFRLPFEGQIGFIENKKLTHSIVAEELNSHIKKRTTITTFKYLNALNLYSGIESSYSSSHQRNHVTKTSFSIFHLLLDYSDIVLNT
jgi:hypothetical protein